MPFPVIEERTLYPPIVNYLNNMGFDAIGEAGIAKKHSDIYFKINGSSFVVEVKIGKPETGLKAIAQAYDYAKKLATENIIILIYPEKYRNQLVISADFVEDIAIKPKEDIQILVLTEFWTESIKGKPFEVFKKIKEKFLSKKVEINFGTVVNLIGGYVRDLNSIIYQIKTENLITEVVNKIELFTIIGEIKDKNIAEKQIINLASYLLFNQLLFYHIYKQKTLDKKLKKLEEIKEVQEIQSYFDGITDIDYQSIYKVNILGHIPEKTEVIETLNNVIKSIKLLRAEHITHDLAGRFFHDLLPFQVRKILAAFYTHPTAADILAGLTIDSWDETVVDPACGSGTLLVSSYKRKQDLYKKLYGLKDLDKLHKRFIENEITGIDIMPFAGHITTINLATQNIKQKTNVVRIGCTDSLSLSERLITEYFLEKGIEILPYTEEVQESLFDAIDSKKTIIKERTLSPEGKGKKFRIKPVDVVIMNPPFTDRNKLPKVIRNKLKNNKVLGSICGNQINLWGYFLALADLLLKPGGKIGAVIPINIARGKATELIRNYLLENYHIRYMVKPIKDIAFSESSAFRDILFIAEKRKPKEKDTTTIIFLKKSLKEMAEEELQDLKYFKSNYVEIKKVRYKELKEKSNNLMIFLMPESFDIILSKILSNNKLINFNVNNIDNGFPYRPKGVAGSVFITRPVNKSRIKNALAIVSKENKNNIIVKLKGLDESKFSYLIPKAKIKHSIRTTTGFNKIRIEKGKLDFIIIEKYSKYLSFLKNITNYVPTPFHWDKHLKANIINQDCYLVLPRKIRLDSKNTYFVSFLSSNNLYSVGPSLYYYKSDDIQDLKIKCLYLNSIISILQILTLKSETLGAGWFELMKSDWSLFKIIDTTKLTEKEKKVLLKLFETIKNIEFPPLLEQIEERFWARIELDKKILEVLSFNKAEINDKLPKIYDIVYSELTGELK